MDQIPLEQIEEQHLQIDIMGVVQGVGFRPFVARAARRFGITGSVQNISGHVRIFAYGAQEHLCAFADVLQKEAPPGSRITHFHENWKRIKRDGCVPHSFAIAKSGDAEKMPIMPSPDLPVCDDCLREMNTAGNRRYRNSFISCTHCGPRFSIMRRAPYDREGISMDAFEMCENCKAEYVDENDRRFHAQTICCNECGPKLFFKGSENAQGDDALLIATRKLKSGAVVAIKGIGGYHLACSAFDEAAVSALRDIKCREEKSFAVMFENLQETAAHCEISPEEQSLLQSSARPIILLKRKASSDIAGAVYGDSGDIGAFLPYTPIQHMLLRETGALVVTSANATSLPIICDDSEMLRFFEANEKLDGILTHNREILRRLDDSVCMISAGKTQMIRRARGFTPLAVPLKFGDVNSEILALGAQQKSTLCFYKGENAFVSAEMGDIDNSETEEVFGATIADMETLLRFSPKKTACDMHPEYFSTKAAGEIGGEVVRVQHHHAHIASVMAEHQLSETVIGVAFDGTGYGTDGTIWGGEFLMVSPYGFARAGHLKTVKFLGADESVRQCWKSAACMLHDAGIAPVDERTKLVHKALDFGVNCIGSSSMGRLFDAVSALLKICEQASYEGQGAIMLENAAERYRPGSSAEENRGEFLPYRLYEEDGAVIVDFAPCISEIFHRMKNGDDPGRLALQFHQAVADMIAQICRRLSEKFGVKAVALGGGVFQNRFLTALLLPKLSSAGFRVYRNEQVPCGDGGISLGQTMVALWEEWGQGS